MTNKKTHWRQVAGKEYLVGEQLNGKETTLTIKNVVKEDVLNLQETIKNKGEKVYDKKAVMYFEKTDLKLVMNVTNLKTTSKVLGSKFVQDWIGKQITLIPVTAKFYGEVSEVIRIKEIFDMNITPKID